MSVLPNVGIHFRSHGNPYGLRIIAFSVLMPGKEIGFNWTNAVSLPRLELSISSMPSALTHNDPGEQQHVRL